MKVRNKTIIVTGGGSGIGRELVLHLLSKGVKVVAIDINEPGLNETEAIASVTNERLITMVTDITDEAAVAALPEIIKTRVGAVDGLINNAGIMHPFVTFNDIGVDVIERVLKVNLFGTIYMTKAFLPVLLERPEAHLLNLASMAAFLPLPGQSAYCASKAAIMLLTEVLHSELSETGVGVTVALPGGVDTNIIKNAGVKFSKEILDSNKSYKMLSPVNAAQMMVKAIEQNKYRIIVGKDATFMDKLNRLNPAYAAKFIYKNMKNLLPSS
jgi:short-subunit dehydrogenase